MPMQQEFSPTPVTEGRDLLNMNPNEEVIQDVILKSNDMDDSTFKLGDTFASFDEFHIKLERYKKATRTKYWVRDARTLETAAKRVPERVHGCNKDLKYYCYKVTCIHGGALHRPKKGSSDGSIVFSLKQGCQASISLSLSPDSKTLFIREINEEHNHPAGPITCIPYFQQQKRDPVSVTNATKLLNKNVNQELIQSVVSKSRDMNDPVFKLGDKFASFAEFLAKLDRYKKVTCNKYWVRDARTLQAAEKRVPERVRGCNLDLKYYYYKLACIHGGAFHQRKKTLYPGKNVVSLKQGCQASISLSLSQDSKTLFIREFKEEHNHPAGLRKKFSKHLPQKRELNPEIQRSITKDLFCENANQESVHDGDSISSGLMMTSIQWSRTCRICMHLSGEEESSDMMEIFTQPQLAATIGYVTNLKMEESDGLPSVICQRCNIQLKSAESFKRLSHTSDQLFRRQLSDVLLQQDSLIIAPAYIMEIELEPHYEGQDQLLTQKECDAMDLEHFNQLESEEQSQSKDKSLVECSLNVQIKQEEISEELITESDVPTNLKLEVEDFNEFISDDENIHEDENSQLKCDEPANVMPTTKKSPSTCTVCDRTFTNSTSMARHWKNAHTDETHKCSKCDLEFTNTSQLKRHVKVHSTDGPYKCEQCGLGFHVAVALLSHMKIHTRVEHQCELCGRVFKQRGMLTQHHKVSHSEGRAYVCNICQAVFKTKYTLTVHKSTHSGIELFLCSYCGKGFKLNAQLRLHHRVHTGERPFSCTLCDKQFTSKSSLSMHMKRHEGTKNYECDTCSRKFLVASTLSRHKQTHSGERPHGCLLCAKTFSRLDHLTTHMLLHTQARNYHCADCQRTFVYKAALVKHCNKCSGKKS